jgi:hypothetical protein
LDQVLPVVQKDSKGAYAAFYPVVAQLEEAVKGLGAQYWKVE